MANERVLQAVAYFEEGNADLVPLHDMGLTAADLDEILELVAWGDKASLEVKDAVERLYEARLAEEEKAGLAIPLVVVKEERRGRRRLLVMLAAIGALLVAVIAWRARHP
ncbi:MAG: hypothetical protein E6J57_03405 [Deltaproteobacteria bacterium]|nr:MAG: hypothetical protein E6J57_03405 [Deltaproteobacteria bacterium]